MMAGRLGVGGCMVLAMMTWVIGGGGGGRALMRALWARAWLMLVLVMPLGSVGNG